MMLLEMSCGAMGDRVASGRTGCDFTTERLMADAGALAGRIRQTDAEHLVVCDQSSPALLTALFGAAWAGVPYVPLNYRLPDQDLRALAGRVTPALAITDDAGAARLAHMDGVQVVSRTEVLRDPGAGSAPAEYGDWPMDPDQVAVLLYTSGTTGAPKSAILRHRHLVSYVFNTVDFGCAEPAEAHLLAVPPYHVASVAAHLSQIYSGRRIVPLEQFDARKWVELAVAENVTHAMLVPTMMTRIVAELQRRSVTLPSLRAVAYGGGKSHRATVQHALELLPNATFSHAYGLTETSSTVAVLGHDDHQRAREGHEDAVRRLGSVGVPLPSLEVTVRDDDGAELAAGEQGEVWVRGEHVSGEYRETGPTLDRDGWFHTRDRGFFDTDGYLYLLGRSDDVIVRGGENMSPGEIEDVLLTHPEVVDAGAFGVPSQEWGEEVAVCVVLGAPAADRQGNAGPDAAELCEHVRTRLRSSRVPAHVHFVHELPYNDTGKLLRRVLKDRFHPRS